MGEAPVKLSGCIGKPLIARGNRNFENYFINGRYIKSNLINKAIEDAYKPFMMQHKYPFTMLHFTIDPSFLDVNVHPAKMELRFRDGEMLYKMIYHTISMALSEKELIPGVELGQNQKKESSLKPVQLQRPEPFEERRRAALKAPGGLERRPDKSSLAAPDSRQKPSVPEPAVKQEPAAVLSGTPVKPAEGAFKDRETGVREAEKIRETGAEYGRPVKQTDRQEQETQKAPETPRQMDLFEDRLLSREARAEHRLIGQLFDTYWLVEYRDKLYIIDQHAAHEKVLYEKTMATLKSREYTSQLVNPPVILTLNESEQLLLERYMDHFTGIGFEIEPFGGKEYAVRAVPANLFSIAKKDLLMEMLDNLSEDVERSGADLINDKIASLSCKAAVKGNHRLSASEAETLIDQLLELENPYACPHGRPTIISMSRYELEKKFKRIV